MKQDFMYEETNLNNLYFWHMDHLVDDGGSVRNIRFEK